MNKQQFVTALRDSLNGLPQSDIEKYLDYYSEMAEDRMEEGLSEEEAIASMESVDDIVRQILTDAPLSESVKAEEKTRRSFKPWEILLLVLGAPLWIPLLIAAAAVILAAYIVLWSVVLAMYAVDLAFAVSAACCIAAVVAMLFSKLPAQAALMLGGGLVCAGIAILLLLVFNKVTVCIAAFSKYCFCLIKSLFLKRREEA